MYSGQLSRQCAADGIASWLLTFVGLYAFYGCIILKLVWYSPTLIHLMIFTELFFFAVRVAQHPEMLGVWLFDVLDIVQNYARWASEKVATQVGVEVA